jgi:hypothetical protein
MLCVLVVEVVVQLLLYPPMDFLVVAEAVEDCIG